MLPSTSNCQILLWLRSERHLRSPRGKTADRGAGTTWLASLGFACFPRWFRWRPSVVGFARGGGRDCPEGVRRCPLISQPPSQSSSEQRRHRLPDRLISASAKALLSSTLLLGAGEAADSAIRRWPWPKACAPHAGRTSLKRSEEGGCAFSRSIIGSNSPRGHRRASPECAILLSFVPTAISSFILIRFARSQLRSYSA